MEYDDMVRAVSKMTKPQLIFEIIQHNHIIYVKHRMQSWSKDDLVREVICIRQGAMTE